MRAGAAQATIARVDEQLRSGDAVFRCDDDSRIVEWNAAIEDLTGIVGEDAVGRPCWDVIAGRDEHGGIVCHPGCSIARLARQGWPVRYTDLWSPTPNGRKRLAISTIVLRSDEEPVILHPVREAREEAAAPKGGAAPNPRLTPRQLEILALLAQGLRVKEIAHGLRLSETTVRNHVRAVLLELGAHSQLEAVAKARAFALVA